MELDVILWMGGMLFSLSIFAVKVGFGLGFSRIGWKVTFFTLSMYLVLFVFIALLSERLIQLLEPVLSKGPYLHALMAAGMIAWGIYLLKRQDTPKLEYWNNRVLGHQKNKHHSITPLLHHSILLLIPCPVCLTAMSFSTWSALNIVKFPAVLVGLGLGILFVLLSLAVFFSLKFLTLNSSLITQRIGLGLSMIGIGLYFIASLYLPHKIEEAKVVYYSFFGKEIINTIVSEFIGVFIILFIAMVIGFFLKSSIEVKK